MKQYQRGSNGHGGCSSHQRPGPLFTGHFSRSDAYERSVATGQYGSEYQKEKEREIQRRQNQRESRGYDSYYGR